MNNIYSDGTYLAMTPSWHSEDSAWKARQIMRGIAQAKIQPLNICDVGCGAGEVLWELADNMPKEVRLIGFEPSPQASALQRPCHDGRIRFIQGDFFEQPSEHFGLVLAIDVFEHIPDYLGFLQALRQRADYAIFHIPMDLTVLNLLNPLALAHTRNTLGHLHFFDRESTLATLKACGYNILCEFLTNWIEELPHRASIQPVLRRSLVVAKAIWGERRAVQLLGGHSLLVVASCI